MAPVVLLVVLAQAIPLPMSPEDAGTPESPPAPPSGVVVRAGVEAGGTLWPEGSPWDGLMFVRPLVSLDVGEAFATELGATFNLLVLDDSPLNRDGEYGRLLRRADWDELSDFGQLIRQLRLGRFDDPVHLRAGPVKLQTLGNGHVVNRYSNQELANYHPAAAHGAFVWGAARGEVFISDLLGPRLFAGLAGVELGRLFSGSPQWQDRFWVTVELAHDFGNAGGATCPLDGSRPGCLPGDRIKSPSATVLYADLAAMVYRGETLQLQLFAGGGTRFGRGAGAAAGLTAELDLTGFLLGLKVEARKQAAGFRQGYFGPQYEVSRFAGAGFSGVPLGDQVLPDSGSVYGELRAGARGVLAFEVAVEHFFWGRTDVDASLQATLWASRLVMFARFTAVAVGVFPRYAVTAEARVRVVSSIYALASGGTVFTPQSDGTLSRGVFASLGGGVDFEL